MSIKGQGLSLTLVKGHSDFKVKICFSAETVGQFGTKIHMKALGRIGMKIYTNELGHMTNVAAMPYMVKTLKKLLLQNQLTSDLETLYVALSMQVLPKLFKLLPWVDLDTFYAKVKFGDIGFCMGKSENYLFFWKLLQP